MKTFFQPGVAQQIEHRIMQLRPESNRQWGTMSLPQALAHCTCSVEMAMGTITIKRASFPLRVFGTLFKPIFFGREVPFKRLSRTAPELLRSNDSAVDFEDERTRLIASLDAFATRGPEACPSTPHAFFGRLTPEQWGALIYKHLDHHLRQFEA